MRQTIEAVEPFGIVTACHRADYNFVKATCASVRHFCPEVPLCVIADGDFDLQELIDCYDVRIIRTTDISDSEMRSYVSGTRRTKLAAMWCGPFERFVYLDCDAIFWGNVPAALNWQNEDFIVFWQEVKEPADRSWLNHFYFDIDTLLKYDPVFRWEWNAYFSAGTFAARRDAISFVEWMSVEAWRTASPNLFSWTTDQGLLNYLVFSKNQRGELQLGIRDLQWIPQHRGIRNTKKRFRVAGKSLPTFVAEPAILHFCGTKPYIHDPRAYSLPFTIARLEHYRRCRSVATAWINVIQEEWPIIRTRISRRLRSLGTVTSKIKAARELAAMHVSKSLSGLSLLQRIVRRLYCALWPGVRYKTEKLFRHYRQVFFVSIGANDGLTNDPYGDMILSDCRYRGILVEPQSELATRLRKNFSDPERFQIVQAAIGSPNGSIKLFSVAPDAPSGVRGLADYSRISSLDRSTIEKNLPKDVRRQIISNTVPCLTWDQLVERYSINSIDLLHIDAEGHDYQILKQIDLHHFQPKIILIEHKHLTLGERDAMEKQLQSGGYHIDICGPDLFCVRRPT